MSNLKAPSFIRLNSAARRLNLRAGKAYDLLWEAGATFRRNYDGCVLVSRADVDALASVL